MKVEVAPVNRVSLYQDGNEPACAILVEYFLDLETFNILPFGCGLPFDVGTVAMAYCIEEWGTLESPNQGEGRYPNLLTIDDPPKDPMSGVKALTGRGCRDLSGPSKLVVAFVKERSQRGRRTPVVLWGSATSDAHMYSILDIDNVRVVLRDARSEPSAISGSMPLSYFDGSWVEGDGGLGCFAMTVEDFMGLFAPGNTGGWTVGGFADPTPDPQPEDGFKDPADVTPV